MDSGAVLLIGRDANKPLYEWTKCLDLLEEEFLQVSLDLLAEIASYI